MCSFQWRLGPHSDLLVCGAGDLSDQQGDAIFDLVGGSLEGVVAAREPLAHAGHTGQIADVLSAIRDGREPIAGGRDGRNAIEVVAAIYKAGIERTFVDLPLAADDPYYRSGHLVERAPHFYEKQTSLVEAAS